jgi:hypothetical protein
MPYIDGLEANLLSYRSLYYNNVNIARSPELAIKYIEREAEYKRNAKKALGAIKATLSDDNRDRFKDKNDASQLWQVCKNTFGESNIELIGRYFNKIINCSLDSFDSADKYISHIQSSALYLSELGYEIPKPYIALILFKGLPSSYDNFCSRKYKNINQNIKDININKLISDIISESIWLGSNADRDSANKTFNNQAKNKYYIYCKNKNKSSLGYLENNCYYKYPELALDG